jgi:hypothetical protein
VRTLTSVRWVLVRMGPPREPKERRPNPHRDGREFNSSGVRARRPEFVRRLSLFTTRTASSGSRQEGALTRCRPNNRMRPTELGVDRAVCSVLRQRQTLRLPGVGVAWCLNLANGGSAARRIPGKPRAYGAAFAPRPAAPAPQLASRSRCFRRSRCPRAAARSAASARRYADGGRFRPAWPRLSPGDE